MSARATSSAQKCEKSLKKQTPGQLGGPIAEAHIAIPINNVYMCLCHTRTVPHIV